MIEFLLSLDESATLRRGAQVLQISLVPSRPKTVVVRRLGEVVWQGIPKAWKPWRLEVADVDGDGYEDFMVGLRKISRHGKNPIGTIYVYGFDGHAVYPKWRGSRLARDFDDFTIAQSANGVNLLTLDRLLNGRFTLSCYRWSGFGFRKLWERGDWARARFSGKGAVSVTIETEQGAKEISTEGKL